MPSGPGEMGGEALGLVNRNWNAAEVSGGAASAVYAELHPRAPALCHTS